MRNSRKPIGEQVVVITGASSGIGRATARLAADAGAKLALNSRDERDLHELIKALRIRGATVVMSVGDVADQAAMNQLAETAVRELGAIDTWVNNAGVSIYGRIEDVTVADARRLFETNYWGVVNGSLAALPHLRRSGGTLITVGSILSDTGYPLQGHYTASKHAVKGFTDSLRLELEHDGAPVSVTLIQPAAIDTPILSMPGRTWECSRNTCRRSTPPRSSPRRSSHVRSARSGTCSWEAAQRSSPRWRSSRPGWATASRRPSRSTVRQAMSRRVRTRCMPRSRAMRGSGGATPGASGGAACIPRLDCIPSRS